MRILKYALTRVRAHTHACRFAVNLPNNTNGYFVYIPRLGQEIYDHGVLPRLTYSFSNRCHSSNCCGTSIPLSLSLSLHIHSASISNYRPPHLFFLGTHQCDSWVCGFCQRETKITDSGRHLISKRVLTQFCQGCLEGKKKKKRETNKKRPIPIHAAYHRTIIAFPHPAALLHYTYVYAIMYVQFTIICVSEWDDFGIE